MDLLDALDDRASGQGLVVLVVNGEVPDDVDRLMIRIPTVG